MKSPTHRAQWPQDKVKHLKIKTDTHTLTHTTRLLTPTQPVLCILYKPSKSQLLHAQLGLKRCEGKQGALKAGQKTRTPPLLLQQNACNAVNGTGLVQNNRVRELSVSLSPLRAQLRGSVWRSQAGCCLASSARGDQECG